MQRSRASQPASLPLTYLVLTAIISATSLVSAFPRDKSQFFTTCWGWGASCSMHSAVGRAFPPVASRPAQRPEPPKERTHGGIPSMVTSGTWEPGTMGKRARKLSQRQHDFLALLERAALESNINV